MKLPKNFGGGGFSNALEQAKQAVVRAQHLEEELALVRIPIDKGPVKAVFNGTAALISLKIDPAVVDPEDVEALEDLIVSAVRAGFEEATAVREAKVKEIMPNIPGMPGL